MGRPPALLLPPPTGFCLKYQPANNAYVKTLYMMVDDVACTRNSFPLTVAAVSRDIELVAVSTVNASTTDERAGRVLTSLIVTTQRLVGILFTLVYICTSSSIQSSPVLTSSITQAPTRRWLGGAVVRALDWRSTGRGFDSWPPHCQEAILGKWFTYILNASEDTTVWRYRKFF